MSSSQIKIKLKRYNKVQKKKLSKRIKTRKTKLSYKMLGISSNEKFYGDEYKVGSMNEIDFTHSNKVFTHLSQYLHYPQVFVKHDVKGHVIGHVSFDKYGEFLIEDLRLESNSAYLRAHIAICLKEAFEDYKVLGLSKKTRFKMLFEFKLTTKGENQDKILDDAFYFSRWKYGVTTGGDQVVHGIGKALINITSWVSLLEYLPESKGSKQRRIRELSKYERSKFF